MNPTLSILLASALSLGAADYSIRSIQILPAGEETSFNVAWGHADGSIGSKMMKFSEFTQEARGDWATCANLSTNENITPAGGGIIQVIVEPRGRTSDFDTVTTTNDQQEVTTTQTPIEGTERSVFAMFYTVRTASGGQKSLPPMSTEAAPRPFQICAESLWNGILQWLNAVPTEPAILPEVSPIK